MRALVCILLVTCAVHFSTFGSAFAQADAEPPAEYKELIDHALAESAAGRFQEAGALFRQANAVYPNARALRGIGMVAFELRDYVEAARYLRLALIDKRRALEPAQRAEVQRLLDRSMAFLGRYDITALPNDAIISVDGRRVQPETDGAILVPLGTHQVDVRTSTQHASAELVVHGGEREPLPVVLQAPTPASAEPESQTTPAPAPEPAPAEHVTTASSSDEDDEEEAPRSRRWLATTATVVGGAALVTGIVLLAKGLADVNTVESAPDGAEWSGLSKLNQRAPVLTGVGIALTATGAALGTAGVVGLVMTAHTDSDGDLDAFGVKVHACF